MGGTGGTWVEMRLAVVCSRPPYRYGLPEPLLDRAKLASLLGHHKGGCAACCLYPGRPADPVQVVLGAVRQVIVDDDMGELQVQTFATGIR